MLSPKEKNSLVVKHNALINFHGHFSSVESKIMCILISRLDRNNPKKTTYSLNAKKIVKMLDTSHKNEFSRLKALSKGLLKKYLSIPTETGFLETCWISSTEYYADTNRIEFTISEKLLPYLFELKEHFTSYRLRNILLLKRSYSLRIYELLKQYESLGEREFTIDKLKQILKADGYARYSNFKQKVLMPAYDELKEKTDIWFEFTEIKQGRSVNALHFTIHTKENAEQDSYQKKLKLPDVSESDKIEKETNIDELIEKVLSDKKKVNINECRDVDSLAQYATQKLNIRITSDLLSGLIETTQSSFERLRDHIQRMDTTYQNPIGFLVSSFTNEYVLPDVK